MRLLLCVLVTGLALLAPSAHAKSIEGTVREAGTRRPVPAATVGLVSGDNIAITDDQGAFVLELPEGTGAVVVIEVDTPGFAHHVESVVLRKSRPTTSVDLYLKSTDSGETRVRERRSKDNVARGTHRIAEREVNELPGTYGDPAKAIENFPGMGRVLLSQGSLFVRGAAPNETAIYVDDYEIPDLYHFTGSTSVINIPFVESVELVPGAFSARYGRSTGGVVAIKTRKLPTDDVHGFAKLDIIDAGAYVGVPLGPHAAVGASARRSYLDALRWGQIGLSGTGNDVVLVPTYWDYQLKLDWDTTPGHELVVFVFGSGDRELYTADGRGALDPYQRLNDSDFHRVSLRYQHNIGSGVSHATTLVGGWEGARLDEQGGLRARVRNSWEAQLRDEVTWRTGSTRVIAGLDATVRADAFRFGGLLADDSVRGLPPVDLQTVIAAQRELSTWRSTAALYVEGNLEPLPGVTLVPGLRLDGMALDAFSGMALHASVEPRVAASWQLVPGDWGTMVRGGAGASSRPPDPDELAVARIQRVALPPQRALQFQAGFEQGLGEGGVFSSTLFAIYRNALTQKSAGFPVPDTFGHTAVEAGGSGFSTGAELLLRYALPGRTFGWLTYSLARHERKDAKGTRLGVPYSYPSAFDTTHLLGAVGQTQLPWGFRFGARYRIASGMPSDVVAGAVFDADSGRYVAVRAPKGQERFPLFHALDVRLDWSTVFPLFELDLYADLVNVLNVRGQEATLYNHDFSESQPRLGLPTIPTIGAKATF